MCSVLFWIPSGDVYSLYTWMYVCLEQTCNVSEGVLAGWAVEPWEVLSKGVFAIVGGDTWDSPGHKEHV